MMGIRIEQQVPLACLALKISLGGGNDSSGGNNCSGSGHGSDRGVG